MAPTMLTEEHIITGLKILSHGGKEAITLFVEMSRRLHEVGASDSLQDWVTIAAPSLPEKERNEVIVMLMRSYLLLRSQTQAQKRSRAQSPILH
jgi:hypothetical protein